MVEIDFILHISSHPIMCTYGSDTWTQTEFRTFHLIQNVYIHVYIYIKSNFILFNELVNRWSWYISFLKADVDHFLEQV